MGERDRRPICRSTELCPLIISESDRQLGSAYISCNNYLSIRQCEQLIRVLILCFEDVVTEQKHLGHFFTAAI